MHFHGVVSIYVFQLVAQCRMVIVLRHLELWRIRFVSAAGMSYERAKGETTEWEDILRKKGIIAPLEVGTISADAKCRWYGCLNIAECCE